MNYCWHSNATSSALRSPTATSSRARSTAGDVDLFGFGLSHPPQPRRALEPSGREALGGELLLAFERDEFHFAPADGNIIVARRTAPILSADEQQQPMMQQPHVQQQQQLLHTQKCASSRSISSHSSHSRSSRCWACLVLCCCFW